MKRIVSVVTLAFLLFAIPVLWAQGNFYDELKKQGEAQIEEAAKPIVEAFGTGVSGGIYHTAGTHGVLGFDLGVRVMMVFVPDGKSDILDSAEVTLFPVPVVQGSIGLPLDAELMLRGFAINFEDESISLIGVGLKKNFKPLLPIPGFPNLSAMVAYHRFKGSDIMTSNHLALAVIVSKKFMIIEPYAGIGMQRTSMNFKYTYVDPNLPPVEIDTTIKASTANFNVGLNIVPFPFVRIFADYSFGRFKEATVGLAVGIR
ncbi:MAG: DUF6588 family protein [bacterium]